ncbi:heme lyase CcmF/NrfE family subunit [Kyrpidia spormannii]|uniref:Cytochrome C biogenesis protein n=1 Tax=Kyrpidia spormannii TaxID=2055160 RepID=A0ACA8ZBS7_9BACL|nr:heme lyase CcmF/NrfE family subunit [Kyrpidia spormannii]CAB3394470.1 Cytochrome C biogenesis protein [Kyrpidia spormannii]
MGELGRWSLLLSAVVLLYMIAASAYGAWKRNRRWIMSGRRAAVAAAGLASLASLSLIGLLVTGDFRYEYVADYTSRDLGILYRISAFWGGNQGSLLLWLWVLTLYTVVVTFARSEGHEHFQPYVTATLGVVSLFFSVVLNTVAKPFQLLPFTSVDGAGLNPLLQNPGMTIHPLTLYLGYIGFSVPFAYAMAAVFTGRADAAWLRVTRRWSLVAWLFLSMGILYGARWAYEVLGWGGYWSWDPVENASLLPWLTATAFIHSSIVQERKGTLKIWNVALVILTFTLTIFGTFLTRSGIFWSVHAFSNGPLGAVFLTFIAFVLVAAFGLLAWRWPLLKSTAAPIAPVSKESSFVLNNVLFVSLTFAVLWGTVFPVISQGLIGRQMVVGPPFFNTVAAPLAVALVLLMGIGTVVAWRYSTVRRVAASLMTPFFLTLPALAVFIALGIREGAVLAALGSIVFVGAITLREFTSGTAARMRLTGESAPRALVRLVGQQRRRYGGYLVHLAVLLIVLGIVVSGSYSEQKQVVMKPGDMVTIGPYQLTLLGSATRDEPGRAVVYSQLLVQKSDQSLGILQPEDWYFLNGSQPAPQVAIRSTPIDDLYVVMAGMDATQGKVLFEIHRNPMLSWIWYGGYLLVAGTLISLWPARSAFQEVGRVEMPGVEVRP